MSTFASDDRDSRVLADVAALPGLTSPRRMTPHTPKPPPQTMRPLDVEPVPQSPHRTTDALPNDAALWMSPERRAAIERAEATDAEETYQERQRREDEERHRAGVARMLAAERRSRDRRDAEDVERNRP